VVVTKAALSRIIELTWLVDGLFVSAFARTAHRLLTHGRRVQPGRRRPILHPTLEAGGAHAHLPAHAHQSAPLVVSDLRRSRAAAGRRESDAHLTLDGQRGFRCAADDVVTVTRSRARSAWSRRSDYFEVLRTS